MNERLRGQVYLVLCLSSGVSVYVGSRHVPFIGTPPVLLTTPRELLLDVATREDM